MYFTRSGTSTSRAFSTHNDNSFIVHVGRKIIHPVGQVNDLLIGERFAHLFDAAVYIAAMRDKVFSPFHPCSETQTAVLHGLKGAEGQYL